VQHLVVTFGHGFAFFFLNPISLDFLRRGQLSVGQSTFLYRDSVRVSSTHAAPQGRFDASWMQCVARRSKWIPRDQPLGITSLIHWKTNISEFASTIGPPLIKALVGLELLRQ
jgi:hypothetical protein